MTNEAGLEFKKMQADLLVYGSCVSRVDEAGEAKHVPLRDMVDTATETEKLLPCPFCGNEPDWKRWEVKNIWQIKIFCDGPGCHVHPSIFGNEQTMTKIWNTRATPQPIDDWFPIETAPKDGTEILVFGFFIGEVSGRQRETSIGVASWYFGNCWLASNTDKYAGQYDATHWMPLPKPPEGR